MVAPETIRDVRSGSRPTQKPMHLTLNSQPKATLSLTRIDELKADKRSINESPPKIASIVNDVSKIEIEKSRARAF